MNNSKRNNLKSSIFFEKIKKCMEYIIGNYCGFPSTPHFTSIIENNSLNRNITFKINNNLYIILSDKFLYHYANLMLGFDGNIPNNFEIDENFIEFGKEIIKGACNHCECDFGNIEDVNFGDNNDLSNFVIKTYKDENGYIFSILYKLDKEENKIIDNDFKITGCKNGKITIEISINKFSKFLNCLLKN